MAKLRNLKKDIDYLISEVLSDCYSLAYLYPDKREKSIEIINEVVDFRNKMFERTNKPDGKNDKKLVRTHYKNISKDLLTGVDEFFKRISELTKE
ncbi:MAG: hypothetical protein LBF04_03425 [Prevotellaceae bacterium]|jgi:hypothetical protein|nr:hypothetical protein [Prevotellaceae bacterium]